MLSNPEFSGLEKVTVDWVVGVSQWSCLMWNALWLSVCAYQVYHHDTDYLTYMVSPSSVLAFLLLYKCCYSCKRTNWTSTKL